MASPVSDKPALWCCGNCDFAVIGIMHDAHQHNHEDGCWDHWLFEFTRNEFGGYPDMTGRHIHTSDWGGFYLDLKPVYQESIEVMFASTVATSRRQRLEIHA